MSGSPSRISSTWSRSPLRSWRWREIPLSLRRVTVTGVDERVRGLVRCRVDGEPCVAYPQVTGPVALGDEVVVNEQARALGLGSGGFDILYANLTRGIGLTPA